MGAEGCQREVTHNQIRLNLQDPWILKKRRIQWKTATHTCNNFFCHLFPAIFIPQIHQTFNPSDPQILSPFRQPGAVLRQVLGPTKSIQASGMNPRSFGIFSAPASQRILVISSFGSASWIHVDSHGSRWKVDVDPFMVLFSNPPKEGKTWVVKEHLEKRGEIQPSENRRRYPMSWAVVKFHCNWVTSSYVPAVVGVVCILYWWVKTPTARHHVQSCHSMTTLSNIYTELHPLPIESSCTWIVQITFIYIYIYDYNTDKTGILISKYWHVKVTSFWDNCPLPKNYLGHIPMHSYCQVFLFFAQGSLPTIAATLMGLMPGKFAR